MSTETDEARTGVDVEREDDWTSDEAAAAQEDVAVDPQDSDKDGVELGDSWAGDTEVLPPETTETTETDETDDVVARDWAGMGNDADGYPPLPEQEDMLSPNHGDGRPLDDEPPMPDQLLSPDPGHPDSGPLLVVVGPDGSAELTDPGQVAAIAEPHTGGGSLLTGEAEDALLGRWTEIQLSFIEDPRKAAQDADTLIQDIVAALLKSLEDRRNELAAGWEDAASDTEQLRQALRQYRSFIGVLLPA